MNFFFFVWENYEKKCVRIWNVNYSCMMKQKLLTLSSYFLSTNFLFRNKYLYLKYFCLERNKKEFDAMSEAEIWNLSFFFLFLRLIPLCYWKTKSLMKRKRKQFMPSGIGTLIRIIKKHIIRQSFIYAVTFCAFFNNIMLNILLN